MHSLKPFERVVQSIYRMDDKLVQNLGKWVTLALMQ